MALLTGLDHFKLTAGLRSTGEGGVGVEPLAPYQLFASGEQGAWIDGSDEQTMFDFIAGRYDASDLNFAGVVGRALNKSSWGGQSLANALGANIFATGDFSSATGFSLGSGWSIAAGLLTGAPATAFQTANYPLSLSAGALYAVDYQITSFSSGTMRNSFGGGTNNFSVSEYRSAAGAYRDILNAGNNIRIQVAAGTGDFHGSVDNMSIRRVPGDVHARSSSNSTKPQLSGGKIQCDATNKLILPFPSSIGPDCTVVWVTDAGVSVLTGQVISGSYDLPYEHWYQCVVINRPLSAPEFAGLTKWMEEAAGLV